VINKARLKVKAVVGDAAYDSREIYEAAEDHGARVVVPPIRNARVNKHSPQARNRSVDRIAKVGDNAGKRRSDITGRAKSRIPSSDTNQ
jgi:hypothetical protein